MLFHSHLYLYFLISLSEYNFLRTLYKYTNLIKKGLLGARHYAFTLNCFRFGLAKCLCIDAAPGKMFRMWDIWTWTRILCYCRRVGSDSAVKTWRLASSGQSGIVVWSIGERFHCGKAASCTASWIYVSRVVKKHFWLHPFKVKPQIWRKKVRQSTTDV